MQNRENYSNAIAYFRSPQAIRERCNFIFDLALSNQLEHFVYHPEKLELVANFVLDNITQNYPDLNVPFHSRWRHFEVGNIPRIENLQKQLNGLSQLEQTQAKLDLAIISVLLDAGAGEKWHYQESETGLIWRRSEGLAIASYEMFGQGLFSSNIEYPFQADAQGLMNLTESQLITGFQVNENNYLTGVKGRLELLKKLGETLSNYPHLFGEIHPRPGKLANYFLTQTQNNQLSAVIVLNAILEGLGEIWPGRLTLNQVNLGDVWYYSGLETLDSEYPFVPFHKLSQWLTYSLLEPLQDLGLEIIDLDQLTGLAEYRNGGLILDLGLLELKDNNLSEKLHKPDSNVIIEWRSLTIIILDKIAEILRQKLNLTSQEFPLVKVLQGGTWNAGREIAKQQRFDGSPPLKLESDGTVF
ncbi:URC4/urg3 family protein [Planktothrix agardhii]|uniref:URC4/urg3 family protein n=1 Tax=Planktothrix agardhii TaxID=1160 RepID=UPI001D0B2AF5|nr:URC4/urg3 family protein [Planktothrix agardhii]MCB8759271.1 URC4/urg3 family protein [Planktothrix agardhii 1813]